jgi:hypothetical protein
MRVLWLVALPLVVFATGAVANGLDQALLRGSTVYQAPSYPIDSGPGPAGQPVDVPPPPQVYPQPMPPTDPALLLPFRFEFGGRYWYSTGSLAKSLYDVPGSSSSVVSRLTYDGLTAHAAEVFGRIDHPVGLFLKGYAGLSGLRKGSLNDEDFAPFIDPYSSTMSDQRDGRLNYVTADIGYTFWQSPMFSLAGFAGYNYLHERTNAHGCNQIASNPFVCVPTIAPAVLGITEEADFHSTRLGIAAEVKFFDRFKLSAEAAWLPLVKLSAADTHWLRLGGQVGDFSGPIPEGGSGNGVQLESLLSFQATKHFSLGVGARYWQLETKGTTDFTGVVVGLPASAQPVTFTTERYGVFVQGAYRM